MLVAAQKYDENVAEYILYMWHLEDALRACNFDMELIRANFVMPQAKDEAMAIKIEEWYETLIEKMHKEGKEKEGHLDEVNEVLIEMLYMHNLMLNITKDKEYDNLYRKADPVIREFASKANNNSLNPIEICLQAQYSKLLLRLQKKEITEETAKAFDVFRDLLAYLSDRFRQMKDGTYPVMNN